MEERKLPKTQETASAAMSEGKKRSILEKLWLTYYNDTLYEQGVITEAEHNRMRVKIKTRGSSMER